MTVFYYDVSSPYAYLAAHRIDELVPGATWRPIAFGILIREVGKVPWSLRPGREAEMQAIAARARERGLPPLRWPPGWPDESYSLLPLRAAMHAEREGVLKPFTLEAYRRMFAEGEALDEPAVVVDVARAVGLAPDAVEAALQSPDAKDRLRAYTDEAIARGVTGVPTVAVGDELFWGDDRLEAAAAA